MNQTYSAPPPAPSPGRRSIFRRWWFWVVVAVVAVIVIAAAASGGGGGSAPSAGGPTTTPAPSAGATEQQPTTEVAPAPAPPAAADDPLSDGGWTVSDIQVKKTQFGTDISARVTNTRAETRTGVFTLTVFSGGQRIYDANGSAGNVEAGQTATVTFIGSTEQLPGDPAGYTYEFQSDF